MAQSSGSGPRQHEAAIIGLARLQRENQSSESSFNICSRALILEGIVTDTNTKDIEAAVAFCSLGGQQPPQGTSLELMTRLEW